MSRITSRSTRPKKLTAKQNVPIFREEQVDNINDVDAIRNQVETGVEKAEESEYHLQQAIKASQDVRKAEIIKDAYIPTPPTISSDIQYDVLYPKGWQQPATYIRSSATVEDCNPISYCMDEEDEIAFKVINAKLAQPMTEDQFEEVITFFEETVSIEQPFASVHAPVMTLSELLSHADDLTPASVQRYAKTVYEHWSSRRTTKQNNSLPPQLKFETGHESDDADPYVCFRRREIRQTRKTRHRDQLSAEKLLKLRRDLESARNLLLLVTQRERGRKEQLVIDKQVSEQRQAFRELKRKLKQPGDDDLLITQKKPKLPLVIPSDQQLAQQLPSRPGPELKTLEDLRADKERAIANDIHTNVDKHIRWNDGYHDKTMFPLTPVTESAEETPFLPAITAVYLPTPPASISEDEAGTSKPEPTPDVEMKDISRSSTPFRYASPDDDNDNKTSMPSFRMRIGRGGRRIIDRKMPFRTSLRQCQDDDRFKFDHDSDEDIDMEDQDVDTFLEQSTRQSNERSALLILRNAQPAANAQATSAVKTQIEGANVAHPPAQQQVSSR
ncbi:Enhancer of polycomb-like protein 1 [Lithohypha guttulata]|nr:Enhancer of polycomb-like protein 1 [Lithohypha guttulata]